MTLKNNFFTTITGSMRPSGIKICDIVAKIALLESRRFLLLLTLYENGSVIAFHNKPKSFYRFNITDHH